MEPSVVSYAETHFARVGALARANGVRLSFHPVQFTVLASSNPGIVERSIEEFEYHANMAKWMGYGQSFQDLKINVHISGREGPAGIRSAYKRLSPEARNCITIENEENAWGLNDCLSLRDIIPTVLDIHHHWIREGEYIDAGSDSALAKNIRPMTLIAILGAYVCFAIADGAGYKISSNYVELLGQWGMLVMSAYFGGRTLEKIMDMRSKNGTQ